MVACCGGRYSKGLGRRFYHFASDSWLEGEAYHRDRHLPNSNAEVLVQPFRISVVIVIAVLRVFIWATSFRSLAQVAFLFPLAPRFILGLRTPFTVVLVSSTSEMVFRWSDCGERPVIYACCDTWC